MKRSLPWFLLLMFAFYPGLAVAQDRGPNPVVGSEPQAPSADRLTPAQQMDAYVTPFNSWAYNQGYTPSVVNMRVTPNIARIVEKEEFQHPWQDGPFMTGTWGGLRETLFEHGVEIGGGYIGTPFWNPVGGEFEAGRWAHQVSGFLSLDFERMAGFKGGSFFVGGRWRGGSVLSDPQTGVGITGLYEPSSYYGANEFRLMEMYYRQTWLDGAVELRLGRQLASNPFADNPITYVFINDAINAYLVGLSENFNYGSSAVTWAAFLRTWPREDVYLQAGVYNNPVNVTAEANHGVDFGFRSTDGVVVMAEACWDPTERFNHQLPGSYLIGGYYTTSPGYTDYSTGMQAGNKWGLYASATQMVYSETPKADELGLSLFATFSWAPPQENEAEYYASAGAVYVGPIPGRDDDQLALGMAYTDYSSYYSDYLQGMGQAGLDDQTVIELTYAYNVTPWLVVQPNVQYLFNPAGNDTVPDALVVGALVAVTF